MDAELENKVKSCTACQDTRNTPSKSLLHPWEWPSKPWARLHVDFFGPFWTMSSQAYNFIMALVKKKLSTIV